MQPLRKLKRGQAKTLGLYHGVRNTCKPSSRSPKTPISRGFVVWLNCHPQLDLWSLGLCRSTWITARSPQTLRSRLEPRVLSGKSARSQRCQRPLLRQAQEPRSAVARACLFASADWRFSCQQRGVELQSDFQTLPRIPQDEVLLSRRTSFTFTKGFPSADVACRHVASLSSPSLYP